jgi:hypothetical protein
MSSSRECGRLRKQVNRNFGSRAISASETQSIVNEQEPETTRWQTALARERAPVAGRSDDNAQIDQIALPDSGQGALVNDDPGH